MEVAYVVEKTLRSHCLARAFRPSHRSDAITAMHLRLTTWIPVLLCLTFVGCASATRLEKAPARVKALLTSIQRVEAEAEHSRRVIATGFDQLKVLVSGNYEKGDVAQAYVRFVQTIDTVELQARKFREVLEPMQASAVPVFGHWAGNVSSIKSDRRRHRGQMRMALTKERYDALFLSAVESQRQLDAFVLELRDNALFLAHDLNPSALDEVRQDLKLVAPLVEKLDQQLDQCSGAARTYVGKAAAPSPQPAPASPGGSR